MENTLTLWSIAQLGIVSTVVTIGVGWIREHLKYKHTTERDATYLANRIAPVLERYALECAELICAKGMDEYFLSHAGNKRGKIPPFPAYPTDIEWRSVDKTMAARLLMFPNEVTETAGNFEFIDNMHQDICIGAYDMLLGKVGYRAWMLAHDLRSVFKLPTPFSTWPFVDHLKEAHEDSLHRIEIGEDLPPASVTS